MYIHVFVYMLHVELSFHIAFLLNCMLAMFPLMDSLALHGHTHTCILVSVGMSMCTLHAEIMNACRHKENHSLNTEAVSPTGHLFNAKIALCGLVCVMQQVYYPHVLLNSQKASIGFSFSLCLEWVSKPLKFPGEL